MDQTPSGDELRPDDEQKQPLEPAAAPPPVEPTEPAPFAPVERDAWDSFVQRDEQEEGAAAEEAPVFASAEAADWQPGPPTTRRGRRGGGGRLTSVLLIILALGLVAATAWGVLQYRQRAMTQDAAQQAVALIGAGAPSELAQRIADIQADLTAGRSELAAQKIADLRGLLAQPPPAGAQPGAQPDAGPLPEEAYQDLPADAATFFRQHEDIFRRFLEMCGVARQLKEKGANVDELRRMRDAVIEAARLGHLETVEKKMAVMLGQLRKQSGGAAERGPLAKKAERLKQAAKRAEAQGRDIRPALLLMQKAEQAAQAGNLEAAGKYIDQALAAVQRAPRLAGGRRFGGADAGRGLLLGGRGPRANPLLPFVRVLLGVMGAEEENLKIVSEQLLDMRELLTGETVAETDPAPALPTSPEVEALKPMVERALSEMQTMAKRRQDLSAQMQGKRAGEQLPQIGPGQRLTPEQRRGMMALIVERLGAVLDRIRAMPEEQYARQRTSLLREIVQAVLRPPQPEQTQQTPPKPAFPQDPEQRIRAKMLEASPVLRQWELEGKDTTQIEALFSEARKALYAREFQEAEQKVDEARKLLGMDQETPATDRPGTGGDTPSDLRPPVDPAIKLDLRGR